MGLDSVELVMEVEEHFNIRLPEPECERVQTVADLAALVLSRLPASSSPCPSARSFFNLRRLLVEHAGLERKLVRPDARLSDLLPANPRRTWRKLRAHDATVPSLVASAAADRAGMIASTALFFALLTGTAVLWRASGALVAVPAALGVLALGVTAIVALASFFRTQFPARIETVGDLAREMVPFNAPPEHGGERLIAQQRVLDEIRVLISKQRGIPVSDIRPESDFARDLGFD